MSFLDAFSNQISPASAQEFLERASHLETSALERVLSREEFFGENPIKTSALERAPSRIFLVMLF